MATYGMVTIRRLLKIQVSFEKEPYKRDGDIIVTMCHKICNGDIWAGYE